MIIFEISFKHPNNPSKITMPKSRKRLIPKKKKAKSSPKPYQVTNHKFVKMENPIPAGIPFDIRLKALLDLGERASTEYEQEYIKLIAYFQNYDPLYLCSFCSRYFTTSQEGIDEEAINGSIDFPDFFVEILQCLSLMSARNLSVKPLNENVYDFKEIVTKFCRNQGLTHLKLAHKAKNDEDLNAIRLRSEMMGHTTAVRNWAYLDQMKEIAYDLAHLIDSEFTKSIEFGARTFLDILFSLPFLAEKKLNIHLQKCGEFLRAKRYDDVLDKYESSFTQVEKTNSAARRELWEYVGQKIKTLKPLLLAHSDLFLTEIYTYNLSEIREYVSQEISEEEIFRILDKLSYQFGDLASINKDHIFLDNPIHSKPFIRLDDNHFFTAVPHLLIHLGVDLLEKFISIDEKLHKTYLIRKGQYLENKVEKLFKNSFPNAQVFSGCMWQCQITNKKFENDLLIIVDDFAIIVECKSGAISSAAKRGAPDRLFKTIEELVIAPSEQAIRFEEYLKSNRKIHKFKTKKGNTNIVDSTKIHYYVPLGITLSFLGTIGCNLKDIIAAKITNHKISELAPSISLTDLEVIFEILELRAEKIHYLSRRREFEAHFNFHGDELDLFGFYLENGFNIGEAEYDDSMMFNLILNSKVLDPYFIGKVRNRNIKKPVLKKSTYWNEILNRLDKTSTNWLMASYILLNLQHEDQIKFEKNLQQLINNIRKGKCTQRHNWMLYGCGAKRRRFAVVGFPYYDTDKETRNKLINHIIATCPEGQEIRGIVVLGYNLNSNHYPYSVLAGSLNTNFFDSLELE